jgi:hypothetical protein
MIDLQRARDCSAQFQISYGLAISLVYPDGKEVDILLFQMIFTCLHCLWRGGGSAPCEVNANSHILFIPSPICPPTPPPAFSIRQNNDLSYLPGRYTDLSYLLCREHQDLLSTMYRSTNLSYLPGRKLNLFNLTCRVVILTSRTCRVVTLTSSTFQLATLTSSTCHAGRNADLSYLQERNINLSYLTGTERQR